MADIKIFNMVEATSIIDTDLIVVEDSADTKKITKANFKETMGINAKAPQATTYTKVEVDGLITSGSNANGNWTKFPDGTLICKHSGVFAGGAVAYTWTFPSAFKYESNRRVATRSISVTITGGAGGYSDSTDSAALSQINRIESFGFYCPSSTDSAAINWITGVLDTRFVDMVFVATGRWK